MKIKNYILTLDTGSTGQASDRSSTEQPETVHLINAALHGWEYEIKSGSQPRRYTSPLPFPEEIRSIDSYTPTLSVSVSKVT